MDPLHLPSERRFEIRAGDLVSFLTYGREAGRMLIEHTYVPDALRGKGMAGRLVRAALEHARSEGLRVVPHCAYAAAYIRRTPEFADLVAGSR